MIYFFFLFGLLIKYFFPWQVSPRTATISVYAALLILLGIYMVVYGPKSFTVKYNPYTQELIYTNHHDPPQKINIKPVKRILLTRRFEVWARFEGLPSPSSSDPQPSEYPSLMKTENLEFQVMSKRIGERKRRRWWANVTDRPDIIKKYGRMPEQDHKYEMNTKKATPYIFTYRFYTEWKLSLITFDDQEIVLFSFNEQHHAINGLKASVFQDFGRCLSKATNIPLEEHIESFEKIKEQYHA